MSQYLKGLIFGLILFLSYLNLALFTPILLFLLIIFSNRYIFRLNILVIISSLILIIVIIKLINHGIQTSSQFELTFGLNIILFILTGFISFNIRFLKGLCLIIICFLMVDFVINLYSFVFKNDPFGRTLDIRTDGKIRLNGVLGHPFLSVAISIISLISSRLLKYKWISAIAILNLVLNETNRARLLLVIIIIFEILYYLFKNKKILFFVCFLLSFLFATIVIFLTITSEDPANILRISAWYSAIDEINKYPFFGGSNFLSFDKKGGVNEEILANSGIAENQYLDIALHLGIPSAILYFIMLLIMFYTSTQLSTNIIAFSKELTMLCFLCFADSFWGNLITTGIVVFFLVIFISSMVNNISNNLAYDK